MPGLFSFSDGVKYLLCVIDVCTKYACYKPLKDKKPKAVVLYGFVEMVNEPNCKPNKLWVDWGREFYNSLIQMKVE